MTCKHDWRLTVPFKVCLVCGKTEMVEPDFVSGDVREVPGPKEKEDKEK